MSTLRACLLDDVCERFSYNKKKHIGANGHPWWTSRSILNLSLGLSLRLNTLMAFWENNLTHPMNSSLIPILCITWKKKSMRLCHMPLRSQVGCLVFHVACALALIPMYCSWKGLLMGFFWFLIEDVLSCQPPSNLLEAFLVQHCTFFMANVFDVQKQLSLVLCMLTLMFLYSSLSYESS